MQTILTASVILEAKKKLNDCRLKITELHSEYRQITDSWIKNYLKTGDDLCLCFVKQEQDIIQHKINLILRECSDYMSKFN